MFINTPNIVILAVAAVLWFATFVLQGKAEKIYEGCVNAFTWRRRHVHHFVCGRHLYWEDYGYKTQPPKDKKRACRDCVRRFRIADAAFIVAFLYYILAMLVLTARTESLLVPLVLASPGLVLAGVATAVATVRKTRQMAILRKQPRAAS